MPTFHPAYLLRQTGEGLKEAKWQVYYDLKAAKDRAAEAVPGWVWKSDTPPDLLEELKKENKKENIIIISAKDSLEDKVTGLDLGADDYLPKPFHLAELIARVKSVIRRNHHAGATYIEYGNIRIDPDHFQVFVAGTPIELNRKEYDILLYFIQRPERVINKMTLAESVWGDHIDQVDNFDFIYAQVKNLRKKI